MAAAPEETACIPEEKACIPEEKACIPEEKACIPEEKSAAPEEAAAMAAPRLRSAAAALDTAVPRDVVLFRHDRSRFFRLAGLFCAAQGLFWTYLAHCAFTTLRPRDPPDPPGTESEAASDPLRPRDHKWRLGFTASCLTLGSLIVAAGCVFPLRCVRRLTLLRGGAAVTISTHGPLGLGRGATFTVPLRHVSGRAHRAQAAPALPIKVRGRPFFFLLDTRGGQLQHPRLFDLTVGAHRNLEGAETRVSPPPQ